MTKTDTDNKSFWTNIGPLAGAVAAIVLILLCLVLTFWVPFVAILIPVILLVTVAGYVMSRRSTPDDHEEQDLADAGYQGPEAEYEVGAESTTGDPA